MYLTYATRMMESRRDDFDEGFTVGREDGLQQGAYENKLETAKNLFSMGFSPEQVSQGTKLPLDVVQGLIQGQ